jgi:ArsR family transcriptional regulator, arsenate/arsenite/antimonite-responsive transcriptional repressor
MVDRPSNPDYGLGMETELAAKRLAELGHKTRLSIFRYLVRVGPEGVPVGQIQAKLGIPGSTLSHHINRLVSVGLIRQVRQSRTLYCVPQFDALKELIEFLLAECCTEGRCNIEVSPKLHKKDGQ